MPEVTDSAVKLFGRSIALSDSQASPEFEDSETPRDTSSGAAEMAEEPCDIEDLDNEDGNPTSDSETTSADQNSEGIDKNSEASKTAAFKKPDKILPCPRCNSMETKFCYFNNYNVNQPRHFCRSCQRYWTAGGAIRNVPVGAGRRKSKHASSQLKPVVISPTGGSFTQVSLINPDSPLCKTMVNRLSLEEPGHFHEVSAVPEGAKTGIPSSCSSMRDNEVPLSNDVVHPEKFCSSSGGLSPLHALQGFPGPLPFPWNFGWSGMSYGGGTGNAFLVPWNSSTMAMSHGFCMPNITFPFVPPMCWGWDATGGNMSFNSSLSPASCSRNSICSGHTSLSLGKHSRDANAQEDEEKNEKNFWIPKTLRIDDPEEAAKSSIWSTLGIKPGTNDPASKGGMFKAFQTRNEGNCENSEADEALKANPAALSRSKAFQEST